MVAFVAKEDAMRRLHDCLVMYDKRPCFIKVRIEDPINVVRLTSTHLYTGEHPQISNVMVDVSTDPKFTLRLPSLGYVNCDSNVYAVRRVPVRGNRSALHHGSIVIETPDGGYANDRVSYSGRHFAAMLMNEYPTFHRALQNVRDGGFTASAFSKTLYIGKVGRYDIGVFSLGRLVGTYNDAQEAFRVHTSRDYSYILAILKKHGVATC